MEGQPLLGGIESFRHLGTASAAFLILNRIIGTGVFSVPSGIYELTGSIGWTLILWCLGGFLAACGFTVYLEYGIQMPESGGEKNYLERVYRQPKHLLLTIFLFTAIFLSFSSSNSYAFGLYIQLGLGYQPNESLSRYIATFTVLAICVLHSRFPHAGRMSINFFGAVKVVILLSIALCAPLIWLGFIDVPYRPNNFDRPFRNDGFGGSFYEVSIALLRVSYSYRGWETCNMVMGEVRNPAKTVARAGSLAILSITILYTLCSLSYFMVIPKEEIVDSGVIIAGVFFLKLFGETGATRLLPLSICLSNLGNILVVSYAMSRVVQNLGLHNILPFSRYIGSSKPWGTPIAGLAIHATMTAITLLAPPPGEVYGFVIDLSTYPVTIFATLITAGLLYLHCNSEKEQWYSSQFRAPNSLIIIYLVSNIAMIVFPWIPPKNHLKMVLPYYASPLGALIVMAIGAIYWAYCKTSGRIRTIQFDSS